MSLFVVYTAVASLGFVVAFEAGRVSEKQKTNKDLHAKHYLPFQDYNWSSEQSKAAAGVFLGLYILESLIFPGSWNPLSFVRGESSSSLLGLLVYGSWSGLLAVGFGGIVALYEGLTSAQERFQAIQSEREATHAAEEERIASETAKASRETRIAVASAAAAAGAWRKIRASQGQLEQGGTLEVAENERVWSKALLKDPKLDPKAIHVVDNAMDKRWREVESGQLNLEELRKQNLAKNQKLQEQRAKRAERATTQKTELETEQEKLEAMTQELEDLKTSLGILKEEKTKQERQKNQELSERERQLKAKEEAFAKEHTQKSQALTAQEQAFKARLDKFEYGDDKLELERKTQQLETSMVNVARFKKEIELEEQKKLKEIQEKEAALKEEEEKREEAARQREAALKEQEEQHKEAAKQREEALKKAEEEHKQATKKRETDLKYQELKWEAIAKQREAALREQEEQWKEIAKQREAALQRRVEEFQSQTVQNVIKRSTAFPEDEDDPEDEIYRNNCLSTIAEEDPVQSMHLVGEQDFDASPCPSNDTEEDPDQVSTELEELNPAMAQSLNNAKEESILKPVSLIDFDNDGDDQESTNSGDKVDQDVITILGDEEEGQEVVYPIAAQKSGNEVSLFDDDDDDDDEDEFDDETTCVFHGIHSDEEREPVQAEKVTGGDEGGRAEFNYNTSLFDSDHESNDGSLSGQIQQDIEEKNRFQELGVDHAIQELVVEGATSPLQEIVKGGNWVQRFAARTTGVTESLKEFMPLSPPPGASHKNESSFRDANPVSPTSETHNTSDKFTDDISVAPSVAPSIVPITSDITSFNYGDRYEVCSSNNTVEGKGEKENRVRFQIAPVAD